MWKLIKTTTAATWMAATAPVHMFNPNLLAGIAASLAGGGALAYFMRNNKVASSNQEIAMAQQQVQTMQLQAASQLEQASGLVVGAPNAAAPQIMGGTAQHMGMMDAAPELARG